MGRSVGVDSGRSVFGGPPLGGGGRSRCGSWPEGWLSSWIGGLGRNGRRWRSVDGFERAGPEVAEGVEGAPGELARDRHRRAGVGEAAGLEREVVGVVGALGPAGGLGGFEQRPAQLWRALLGQLANPGAAVGAVDADVEAGPADGLARGGQTRDVTEFAEDHRRGQLAYPELALERPTARLAAGEPAQLLLERAELAVDRVDQRQRDLDPLAVRRGQLESLQELAPGGRAQLGRHAAHAVVEERRPDPLQPARALVDQRLAQPGAG